MGIAILENMPCSTAVSKSNTPLKPEPKERVGGAKRLQNNKQHEKTQNCTDFNNIKLVSTNPHYFKTVFIPNYQNLYKNLNLKPITTPTISRVGRRTTNTTKSIQV